MPSERNRGGRGSNLKDPTLYDELRNKGNSPEKSARISNAVAARGATSVATKGGESPSYDDWTVADLRKRAKDLGMTGYSSKKKAQLVQDLRTH